MKLAEEQCIEANFVATLSDQQKQLYAIVATATRLDAVKHGMRLAAGIVHKGNVAGYDCHETNIFTAANNLKDLP